MKKISSSLKLYAEEWNVLEEDACKYTQLVLGSEKYYIHIITI